MLAVHFANGCIPTRHIQRNPKPSLLAVARCQARQRSEHWQIQIIIAANRRSGLIDYQIEYININSLLITINSLSLIACLLLQADSLTINSLSSTVNQTGRFPCARWLVRLRLHPLTTVVWRCPVVAPTLARMNSEQ